MNKKPITFIIILVVLVALLIGASLGYKHLSKNNEAQNLISNGETVYNDGLHADSDDAETTDNTTSDKPGENAENDQDTSSDAINLDFIVTDWSGNEVNLSDFYGKPIILNFWASWCGPCKAEMPDFNEMHAQYGENIHFVMVNVTDGDRETIDSAKAFIEDAGYTFPVYFDTTLSASYVFQAYSLPTTYFMDAKGNPVAKATGTITKDTLQKGIDMINQP